MKVPDTLHPQRQFFHRSDIDATSERLSELRRDIDSAKVGAKEELQQFEEQNLKLTLALREVRQTIFCNCTKYLIELTRQSSVQ